MKEDLVMRPFEADEVEPEDAIRMFREKEQREEQERLERMFSSEQKQERDPIRELGELLDKVDAEMQADIDRAKRKCMGRCALFGGAAGIVMGAMAYGLINPMFALPLTAVYLMRMAVHYDRWARM